MQVNSSSGSNGIAAYLASLKKAAETNAANIAAGKTSTGSGSSGKTDSAAFSQDALNALNAFDSLFGGSSKDKDGGIAGTLASVLGGGQLNQDSLASLLDKQGQGDDGEEQLFPDIPTAAQLRAQSTLALFGQGDDQQNDLFGQGSDMLTTMLGQYQQKIMTKGQDALALAVQHQAERDAKNGTSKADSLKGLLAKVSPEAADQIKAAVAAADAKAKAAEQAKTGG